MTIKEYQSGSNDLVFLLSDLSSDVRGETIQSRRSL